MVGPALQGAALLSRANQAIPWALTAASFAPGLLEGAQQLLNRSAAAYNPGGGGMGGRRGTRGQSSAARIGNFPAGYTQSELAAGAAAESFREGAGFPGQQATTFASTSSPIERAYQTEKAAIAQLSEQDPLFKKYQVADLTKAYNAAASPEEKEKIGLQIWATTNPELAKRVRPGQVGYQTSASMSGSQVFGTDIPGVTQAVYSQASEAAGLPSTIQFPSAEQMPANAFGLGANAQQLGISAPGQMPPSMIGTEVFKRDLKVPSSEELTQTQLALLKQAFAGRLK